MSAHSIPTPAAFDDGHRRDARTERHYLHAQEYSSVASSVHTQLLDALSHGRPTLDMPGQDVEVRALRHALRVGGRYAPTPDGNLDSRGSTSEALGLANELKQLASRVQAATAQESFDMQDWVRHADQVLNLLRKRSRLNAAQEQFAREQLQPFLASIVELEAEEPVE